MLRGWAEARVRRIEARDSNGTAAVTVLNATANGQPFEVCLLRPKANAADAWDFEIHAETHLGAAEALQFSVAIRPHSVAITQGPVWDDQPETTALAPLVMHPERTVIEADGTLSVQGWLVATEEIAGFRLNGTELAVDLGLARPDVAALRSRYPNAAGAGFQLRCSLTDASASLLLEALSVTGFSQAVRLCPERLAPPPQTVDPRRVIKLYCDEAVLRSDDIVLVSGWAISPVGVRDVRLFLGDLPLGEAEFGLARDDVGEEYPAIPMARFSGFRARVALDPEVPRTTPLRIVARNALDDTVEDTRALEPRAAPAPSEASGPADPQTFRIEVDSPAIADGQAIETIGKRLTIDGWALADGGVESIDVIFDGAPIGRAHYGTVRQDVARAFPGREDAIRCGYAFHCPPRLLRPGYHTAELRALRPQWPGAVANHQLRCARGRRAGKSPRRSHPHHPG